ALELSQCNAAASLAVEDTPTGAESAVAAGIPTLVLLNDSNRSAAWPPGVREIKTLGDVREIVAG
ncbi:MAG: hypothetical protein RLN70_10680, partial [Rhodospirillaceae bacterium]